MKLIPINIFIGIIILLKVAFIFFALKSAKLKHTGKQDTASYKNTVYWKERAEFAFIACMSVLLIYLFNPRTVNPSAIVGEQRVLLFIFGWVLLITADWGVFFKEARWQ